MLFLALIIIFSAKNVFAQDQYTLTLEKQDGIYMTRQGVSYGYDSYPYYIYKMDGMFAYCIEPGKHISTYTYVGNSDYVDLGFSEELKEKLELIGYYGRDYPGHNNVRYSMAAQALIWELTGVDSVTFWTKQNEQGDEIDISKERNEIMNLVNNHKTLPSFKTSYQGYLKREITITDTNKVLNNYEIQSSGIENVSIDNNILHITPNKVGTYTITLKRKSYDEYNTIIFVGKGDNSSQKLGRLHFNKEIKTNITINVSGISLLVQKVNENNQNIKISNIKFKVKDLIRNKYLCINDDCVYKTNTLGNYLVGPLDYGEYEIEELEDQFINGYSWNSEKLHVSLNEDTVFKYNDEYHNYLELSFKNNSVLGTLEVYKKGERLNIVNNEVSYRENNIVNMAFEVYDNNNKLVKTFSTNSKGYGKASGLKVGKYYLLEKYTLSNYIKLDKIPFEIKQENQYQTSIIYTMNVKNILKKGNLEFSKVDSKTNKGIMDTVIEIYNEYNTLLLTKTTDANGKVIVNNLPVGKYYIKEKEANYYYKKTNEKLNFEINENEETVKVKMTNDKIMGKVELEKYGEEFLINNNEVNYKTISLANIEFNLYNEKKELIDTLKTNNEGYLSKELELGKYYIQEKTKLLNYQENNDKYYFEIKKNGNEAINVRLMVNNYLKKGSVEFNKEELLTLKGIDNTIVELYNDNNELLLTRKTNSDGKIIINNLPVGKYYFKEKEANYYFKITDEIVPFEIKKHDEVVKTHLTNEKIVGNLEINKLGENYHFINNEIVYENDTLHNIEFDIYDKNDNIIGSFITDKNGYGKYDNLPLGEYYLREKTGLDRYLNVNKYPFEIKKGFDNQGIDVHMDIVNKLKKGNLEFSKEDLITSEGIPNTIIEIYNDKDMLLLTKKTDKFGKVIINNLPFGKYYIVEKEANYYYEKTDEKVMFEIKENGEIVKAKMTNKKILGNLEIEKHGEKYLINGEDIIYEKINLPDIQFALYDETNNLITTLKTDENGIIKYANLPLGKYYLIEKNMVDDYLPNTDKIYFEIKKDGNSGIDTKLTIDNYLKKGSLEFSKVDLTTSEGIPNTIIEIYNDNDELLFTKKTDELGKVVINNLPLGKYYIVEKEANSLYMITNEKVLFEIKEDGEIVKANMTNEKIEIPVPKTKTNESIIANSLFSIMFLIGIGRMYYEKKESY